MEQNSPEWSAFARLDIYKFYKSYITPVVLFSYDSGLKNQDTENISSFLTRLLSSLNGLNQQNWARPDQRFRNEK